MSVAADPEALSRLGLHTAEIADRTVRAAAEVGDALDQLRTRCPEHVRVGAIDVELRTLASAWRQLGQSSGRFAADLRAADDGPGIDPIGGPIMPLPEPVRHMLEELGDRLADGDLDIDDVDAVVSRLAAAYGDATVVPALVDYVRNVGRFLAVSGAADNGFTRWAMRAGSVLAPGGSATLLRAAPYAGVGVDVVELLTDFRQGASGFEKVKDGARLAFDTSTIACASSPTPWTCGAAGVSGAVWGGMVIAQRREAIGRFVARSADQIATTARLAAPAAGLLVDRLVEQVASGGAGPDLLSSIARQLPGVGLPNGLAAVIGPPGLLPLPAAHGARALSSGIPSAVSGGARLARQLTDGAGDLATNPRRGATLATRATREWAGDRVDDVGDAVASGREVVGGALRRGAGALVPG